MPGLQQTMWVHIVCVKQSNLLGFLVHQRHKARHVPADGTSNSKSSIVTRGKEQAVEHFTQSIRLAFFYAEERAISTELTDIMIDGRGNGNLLVWIPMLDSDYCRHQFGCAQHRQMQKRIMRIERCPCICVEQIGRCGDHWRGRMIGILWCDDQFVWVKRRLHSCWWGSRVGLTIPSVQKVALLWASESHCKWDHNYQEYQNETENENRLIMAQTL